MAGSYIAAPVMMTAEEYMHWSEKQLMKDFFRKKNDEIYQAKGKEKFDFSDMHFDLGPAEKIFGISSSLPSYFSFMFWAS